MSWVENHLDMVGATALGFAILHVCIIGIQPCVYTQSAYVNKVYLSHYFTLVETSKKLMIVTSFTM